MPSCTDVVVRWSLHACCHRLSGVWRAFASSNRHGRRLSKVNRRPSPVLSSTKFPICFSLLSHPPRHSSRPPRSKPSATVSYSRGALREIAMLCKGNATLHLVSLESSLGTSTTYEASRRVSQSAHCLPVDSLWPSTTCTNYNEDRGIHNNRPTMRRRVRAGLRLRIYSETADAREDLQERWVLEHLVR